MSYIPDDQPLPFTSEALAADLRNLGVAGGSTLVVHSSLSSLGYVTGGAHAVVLALRDVLGPEGTLVVPTHSGSLSDPAQWQHPPVSESWWATIRESMPAYDPALTPTEHMGAVAELVRHLPAAVRSAHPTVSFAAVGPNAAAVTDGHELGDGLGETSPLARLYDLDAAVLLLGVGHANNTSLHLAEHRSRTRPTTTDGVPLLVDGHRRWVTYSLPDFDTSDFDAVGAAATAAGLEVVGTVGRARARLVGVPALVDFATAWFVEHRPALGEDRGSGPGPGA
jgi:aminoglycoside 3-N-acetyltransferase